MKYLFLIICLVMIIGILYFFCFIYFNNPPNMGAGGTGSENKNQNDILKEILKELKRLKKDEL